jgi:hypothetical protein
VLIELCNLRLCDQMRVPTAEGGHAAAAGMEDRRLRCSGDVHDRRTFQLMPRP